MYYNTRIILTTAAGSNSSWSWCGTILYQHSRKAIRRQQILLCMPFVQFFSPPPTHKIEIQSIMLANTSTEDDDPDSDPNVLPESISITRIDDLLAQMRVHEVPKRALFSIPFQLAKDFVIGVKGQVSQYPNLLI